MSHLALSKCCQVTHTYDSNGNLTIVVRKLYAANRATSMMGYDYENRQIWHTMGEAVVTYTYSGDGLKRSEIREDNASDPPGLAITTLVWDGSDYLQERK